jgi:hypothetical protein
MSTYLVSPLVPGDLGPGTEMDASVHPPLVRSVHFVFNDWLGDDLVEAFPIFLATERLASMIDEARLTGVTWAPVRVEKDAQADMFFDWRLPEWRWLRPGIDRQADFWMDELASLHVSERALATLRASDITHAEVSQDVESACERVTFVDAD